MIDNIQEKQVVQDIFLDNKDYSINGYSFIEDTAKKRDISERTIGRRIGLELLKLGLSWTDDQDKIMSKTKKFYKVKKTGFKDISDKNYRWYVSNLWLDELGYPIVVQDKVKDKVPVQENVQDNVQEIPIEDNARFKDLERENIILTHENKRLREDKEQADNKAISLAVSLGREQNKVVVLERELKLLTTPKEQDLPE